MLFFLFLITISLPAVILIDSKKRLGKFSWGFAFISLFTMMAVVGRLKTFFLETSFHGGASYGRLLGWPFGAWIGFFFLYRTMSKVPNGKLLSDSEPDLIDTNKQSLNNDDARPMKLCPTCCEKIPIEAIKCKYCREIFDPNEVTAIVEQFKNEKTDREKIKQDDWGNKYESGINLINRFRNDEGIALIKQIAEEGFEDAQKYLDKKKIEYNKNNMIIEPDNSLKSKDNILENEIKKCPFCAETIKLAAKRCTNCKENFDPLEVNRLVKLKMKEILEEEKLGKEKYEKGLNLIKKFRNDDGILLIKEAAESGYLDAKKYLESGKIIYDSNKNGNESYKSDLNAMIENEVKNCPFCSETIKLEAKKCKYCNEMFDNTEVYELIQARQQEFKTKNLFDIKLGKLNYEKGIDSIKKFNHEYGIILIKNAAESGYLEAQKYLETEKIDYKKKIIPSSPSINIDESELSVIETYSPEKLYREAYFLAEEKKYEKALFLARFLIINYPKTKESNWAFANIEKKIRKRIHGKKAKHMEERQVKIEVEIEKQPISIEIIEGVSWKCPECGNTNEDYLARCVCGYVIEE